MNTTKRNTKPLKILLIEDDEDDFVLTKELIGEVYGNRAKLEWIDNPVDGLAEMTANRHDVYLLDYRLGDTTGLDLIKRAIESGCRAPIILLTGQGDQDVDIKAMRAGATDYLVKREIDGALLERTIRYAIRQKQNEADLAEMQRRLADGREQERLVLAQELHDGPLQNLIAGLFQMGIIQAAQPEKVIQDQLDELRDGLQAVVSQLRVICGDLRPPALAPFGLERAIRAHAQLFRERHPHIQVRLSLDSDAQTLPEHTRLALYRIYQHALSNVVKHAEATEIRVRLRLAERQVKLQIQDNGKGFEPPRRWLTLAREGHYGLLGSRERAQALGGRFVVRSNAADGTTLTTIVPRPRPGVGEEESDQATV